jgi:predicted RNase H-like nuclease
MSYVAGVDGCKNGWFAVFLDLNTDRCEWDLYGSIQAILDSIYAPKVVAIDIPIGLLEKAERGGRPCDRDARDLLGQPRARSVFSPPVREALVHIKDYQAALAANRRSSSEKVGISMQCHALFAKLNEADMLTLNGSRLKQRIFEVHPELCFYQINGCRPMRYSKRAKSRAGIDERKVVLRSTPFAEFLLKILGDRPKGVAEDDALDAIAACWTALRIKEGEALPKSKSRPNIWR